MIAANENVVLEDQKSSLNFPSGGEYQTLGGQDMDEACGRVSLTQLDSGSTSLIDLSDQLMPSLYDNSNSSGTSTTVLPPVSTFLLPSFRDSGWWNSSAM